jgi:hypothetical protein
MRNDFCVFILSHGRADKVTTLTTIQRMGYDGHWYIVIDNEDKQSDEYYKRYGKEHVVMFDKLATSKTFDTADNFDDRRCVVYARNACFDIAKDKGYKYFLELDDDYTKIEFRRMRDNHLSHVRCNDLNPVIDEIIKFLDTSKALTVAFAQGGDFVVGAYSNVWKKKCARKAMNCFFCTTERPFKFIGRVNEDVNTYTYLGTKGELLFTVRDVVMEQERTQQSSGGMTEMYLDEGTFIKSFYSVMYCPSCVKISKMGVSDKRIHHKVLWKYCTPKIISDKYKKAKEV